MNDEISNSELLRVAYDDELLRKELRRQSGKEWPQLLAALKSGPKHPSAELAVGWIKQIVGESREKIATLIAEQDCGEYLIYIFGFDQICSIWVPEFGSQGPFLSHDDAINFALDSWSEFLTSDEIELHRGPSSRAEVKAAKERAKRDANKAPVVKFRIDFYEYSKVGRNKYYRHPRRIYEQAPPFTAHQLASSLVNKIGSNSKELMAQIVATGWDDLILQFNRVSEKRIKKYQMDAAKGRALFAKSIVKFFDNFLQGKNNRDAEALDSAAHAWVWRNLTVTKDHPEYEDRAGAIQRYGRQMHREALGAYLTEKGINPTKALPRK